MTGAAHTRNASLDGLKFISAVTLAVYHVALNSPVVALDASRPVGSSVTLGRLVASLTYWGLPLFFMASGYLHGDVGNRGNSWRRQRAMRLLRPYVVWSAFYLSFSYVRAVAAYGVRLLSGHPHQFFAPEWSVIDVVFFAGAQPVLWFLPILVACALIADIAVRSSRSRQLVLGLAVVATLVTQVLPLPLMAADRWSHYYAAPQWFVVYLLGMFIAAEKPTSAPPRVRGQAVYLAAFIPLVVVSLLPSFALSLPPVAGRLTQFVVILLPVWVLLRGAAHGADPVGASRLSVGGALVLGIFVVHPAWIMLWSVLAARLGVPPAFWIVGGSVVVVLGSIVTVALLTQSRWTRWAIT